MLLVRFVLCALYLSGTASVGRAHAASAPPAAFPRIARIGALERARTTDRRGIDRALAAPDAALRRRAAIALGRLRDSVDVAALAARAGDRDADVRAEVAFALGQIASPG